MNLPTPNYTQVPNFIIDEMMAKLTHSEFKVIMLILRRTIGYHRREAYISYNQFETICGVSDRWALKCIQKMEKLGWIEVVHGNKTTANMYRVLLKLEEKCTSELSSPPPKEVPNSVHQGTELSSPGVPNSVRTINKVKESPKEKDNVLTVPSSAKKRKTSPDNFINSLNPEQKKLHDSLIKHRPDWGQHLKSEDVCAWFLAKKYTIQQVTDAFLVYRQDAAEAKSKGRVLRDMGAYVVGAIMNKRIPKNQSFEANKHMAISSLAKQENMKAMDKYVSYQLGAHEDQIPYSLPLSQFTTMLEETKRKINNQQEDYSDALKNDSKAPKSSKRILVESKDVDRSDTSLEGKYDDLCKFFQIDQEDGLEPELKKVFRDLLEFETPNEIKNRYKRDFITKWAKKLKLRKK